MARRKKAQEWGVAKINKDALLTQLTTFKKIAKDLTVPGQFGRSKRIRIGQLFGNPMDRVVVLFKVLGRTSAI